MKRDSKLYSPVFMLVWVAGLLQEQAWSMLVHFPGLLGDLGADETRIGVLYSVAAVAGLALRPLLGRLMDVIGRRQVLLFAGLADAIAIGLMATVSSIGPLLILVFVGQRVMQIALFTAMLTLSADVVPADRRTEGLAIFGLSGLIPLATGGALGDIILGVGGFDLLFAVAASTSVVSWLLVWWVPRRSPATGTRPRRGFWSAIAQRDLLPVWWLTLVFAVGMESLFTFLRTFVDEEGVGTVGSFLLVYGLVAIVARVGTSGRLDLIPQRALVTLAVTSYGLSFLVLAAANGETVMLVAAGLGGFGHGLLFPVLSSQVVIRARTAERGSAMAIFTSLFDVAILVAAPIVGATINWRGYSAAYFGLGWVILGGLVIYLIWDRASVKAASATQRCGNPGL